MFFFTVAVRYQRSDCRHLAKEIMVVVYFNSNASNMLVQTLIITEYMTDISRYFCIVKMLTVLTIADRN